ncbi:hypothetical protein ThrDRAFT_00963 [Frankia casuarinae]|nr:hypothetical protein CcI6DRAFT_01673 [Frankia sp. CcI6]EYT93414.1 hypothetical protein ThrDRAFT_00963 [Frankia casuarinae]KDA43533.1 hypothetical protein BMG523Draft_01652 [Frankia sp. BMG5.23]KFB06212.1 hypothetical protein ALLO2DRAFT_01126 [Frankia sp. Allo2]OAA25268.1 hypothetical protein AAY23_104011 [Frankia casuarinae]
MRGAASLVDRPGRPAGGGPSIDPAGMDVANILTGTLPRASYLSFGYPQSLDADLGGAGGGTNP